MHFLSLQGLEKFIKDSNETFELVSGLDKDDYSSLLKILEALNQIKSTEIETDNMFDPLNSYVQLLADYNVEFEPKVYDQFAELPELWSRLKKRGVQVKQEISQVQKYQVDLIHKRISLFDFRMQIYREKFKNLPVRKFHKFQIKSTNINIFLFFFHSSSLYLARMRMLI